MINSLKFLLWLLLAMASISSVNAREIQCKISDVFDNATGRILFEYDDTRKVLTIVKTSGEDAVLTGEDYAWIREAVGKPANDISEDPNVIWARHQGEWNWEFKLDRKNGTIQINQTQVRMSWKGRCTLVDRSNKF
jgi:hypothetical protein